MLDLVAKSHFRRIARTREPEEAALRLVAELLPWISAVRSDLVSAIDARSKALVESDRCAYEQDR